MSEWSESQFHFKYTINRTWDNQAKPDNAGVTVILKKSDLNDGTFVLRVDAPFYDDPKLPPNTPPGRVDGLWDYEVVEVFFLGSDDNYLEIEVGPHGHYLLYYLEGVKNVTKNDLRLEYCKSEISADGRRWTSEARIPVEYLPPNVCRFNAYAIHGSDPQRVYMALFPVGKGEYEQPNFHRLEPFCAIDLRKIL